MPALLVVCLRFEEEISRVITAGTPGERGTEGKGRRRGGDRAARTAVKSLAVQVKKMKVSTQSFRLFVLIRCGYWPPSNCSNHSKPAASGDPGNSQWTMPM